MKFYTGFLLALTFALSSSMVAAHGNDDHEHAAPVANVAAVAPRASAQTEEFEMVAVLQGTHLVIYLDRFDTNRAVNGAVLEVESVGKWKLIAKEGEAGVYVVDLPKGEMALAGKYPLTFSIQTEDSSDVMTASIDIVEEENAHDHGDTGIAWWKWLLMLSSGMGLLVAILIVVRARSRSKSLDFSSSFAIKKQDLSGGEK